MLPFIAGSSTLPEALKKFSRPWTPTHNKRSKTVRVRSADSGKVHLHLLCTCMCTLHIPVILYSWKISQENNFAKPSYIPYFLEILPHLKLLLPSKSHHMFQPTHPNKRRPRNLAAWYGVDNVICMRTRILYVHTIRLITEAVYTKSRLGQECVELLYKSLQNILVE